MENEDRLDAARLHGLPDEAECLAAVGETEEFHAARVRIEVRAAQDAVGLAPARDDVAEHRVAAERAPHFTEQERLLVGEPADATMAICSGLSAFRSDASCGISSLHGVSIFAWPTFAIGVMSRALSLT